MRATERAAQGRRALRRFRRRACEARRAVKRVPRRRSTSAQARAFSVRGSSGSAHVRPVAVCAAYRAPAPSPRRMPRRAPAQRRGAASAGHAPASTRGGPAVRGAWQQLTARRGRARVRLRACLFVCLRLFVCVCAMGAAGVRTSVSHAVGQRTTADFSSGSAHPRKQTHTQPSANARASAGGRRAGTHKRPHNRRSKHTNQ